MTFALPIAVIGCGAIAESYYFPILSSKPGLRESTWIVEPAVDRAKSTAERFGFRADQVVASIADLPNSIRMAINATPSHLHLVTTRDLLARDIQVLIEKPLAEIASDADEILKLAGVKSVLTVNHFRRLIPSYGLVRQYIQSGKLGDIRKLSWKEGHKFNWPTQSGFNFRRPWPDGRPRGALLDIGVHVLDVICWWLGGQPKVRSAEMDGYGGPEGFANVHLKLNDRTDINVQLSFHAQLQNSILIEGTEGDIRLGCNEFGRFEFRAKGGRWQQVKAAGGTQFTDFAERIVSNFIAAVEGAEPLIIEGSSVVSALRVIDEIYLIATDPLPACYQEWVA